VGGLGEQLETWENLERLERMMHLPWVSSSRHRSRISLMAISFGQIIYNSNSFKRLNFAMMS
jgi:hypothetical protein